MSLKRATKGHYGYRSYKKTVLLVRCAVLTAAVTLLAVLGLQAEDTMKSWFLVFALLTAIPLAMQISAFVKFLPFKTPERAEYEEIRKLAGDGVLDLELIIPNRFGKAYDLTYAFVHETGVYGMTKDAACDTEKAAAAVRRFLKVNGADAEVRIVNDPDAYRAALRSLSPSHRKTVDDRYLKQEGVLRAVSL